MTQRRPTQERSWLTRAALREAAATEFERYGYLGGSVNRILDKSGKTKGSLYFHFTSKFDIAEAVLDEAEAVYTAIGEKWSADDRVEPADAIAFMVHDAADAYDRNSAVRAESRMALEFDFSDRRSSDTWQDAVADLARRADETQPFREGFTAAKFARLLATSLAGQRYIHRMVPVGEPESIHGRYDESLRRFSRLPGSIASLLTMCDIAALLTSYLANKGVWGVLAGQRWSRVWTAAVPSS